MKTNYDQFPVVLQASHIQEILDVSKKYVYELLHRSDFPTVHVTEKRMVVPKEAFIRWLDEQATKGA